MKTFLAAYPDQLSEIAEAIGLDQANWHERMLAVKRVVAEPSSELSPEGRMQAREALPSPRPAWDYLSEGLWLQ